MPVHACDDTRSPCRSLVSPCALGKVVNNTDVACCDAGIWSDWHNDRALAGSVRSKCCARGRAESDCDTAVPSGIAPSLSSVPVNNLRVENVTESPSSVRDNKSRQRLSSTAILCSAAALIIGSVLTYLDRCVTRTIVGPSEAKSTLLPCAIDAVQLALQASVNSIVEQVVRCQLPPSG